jgi:hypothetical protein
MRILSLALLLAGLSVFTLGCTGDVVKPVETDGTSTEATEEGHTHEEGEEHMHEGSGTKPAGETTPVAPAPEAPAPEFPAPEFPAPDAESPAVTEEPAEGGAEVPAPELDLDIEN